MLRQGWISVYCVWGDKCCVVGYFVWGDRFVLSGYFVWGDRC